MFKIVGTCLATMALLVACGGEEDADAADDTPGPSAEPEPAPEAEPESEPAAEPESEPAAEPESEPESDPGPLEPPTMEGAEPLTGDLHVTWSLPDSGCDMIKLWRNEDGGEFELVFTLTGVAESQHDSSVDPPTEYCYKAACVRDGEESAESNEVCGTP